MVSLEFLAEVKLPVGVEVARGAHGPEAKHGLGARERPAGAGAVHAVLDEVSARSLDDAGCDGQAIPERVGVVHEAGSSAVGEVAARGVDSCLGRLVELFALRPPTDRFGDLTARAAREQPEE